MVKDKLSKFTEYKYKYDILWLIFIPVLNVIYFISNNIYVKGYDLSINLDKQIPFINAFIIPYVYWYVFMILGYLFIAYKDRRGYMRAILSLYAGMIICYLFFFVFPTEIIRPVISDEGFLNKLVNLIYINDRPFNCFPSLHVLGTYFVMRYTKKEYGMGWYMYTNCAGILITLSTLFIKQHFILDIFMSIIIVEIIKLLVKFLDGSKIDKLLNIPYTVLEKIKKLYEKNILIK